MKVLPRALRRAQLCVLASVLLAACVDAPSAPESAALPPALVIAPVFSLQGPDGPAMSEGQEDALSQAFDRVDRFRMRVRRASDNVLVIDTLITVTPGEDEYDLSVALDAKNNEQFLVTLTALQEDTELFTAENIPATASPASSLGSTPPPPIQISLVYSGPGATAAAVTMGPTQVVLAPGSSATVGASVTDAAGAVIAGVPLAWSTSAPGIATVTGGQVGGAGEGVATVTATTPTGLAASATIYVATGEMAYVEGASLRVRDLAGGTPVDRAGGGASQPAWSADGAQLFFVAGGSVQRAGGPALLSGTWPSLSPDGTKLAVERGGQVVFANEDGSSETPGPSGTTPVWNDGATLLVGGGSIERVRADGTDRQTVVAGDASFPALAGDGRVASVVGGALRVSGVASPLVAGATGRSSWSPNGMWLVVGTGSGLMLVPSDGSAEPVPLPGLEGASDPAFRRAGALTAASSVSVTGFNPDPPLPGSPVQLLGSGFDWIIPSNNRVVWPTRDGTVDGEIQSVSASGISTVMPRSVIAGQVRVETRASASLLAFEPTVGALDVTARTPWGAGVAGVGLSLAGSEGVVAATTDAEGLAQFPGLLPGAFTLTITPPDGHSLTGEAVRALTIGAEVLELPLELTPNVGTVTLSPDPLALSVGSTLGVTLQVTDASGLPVPEVEGLVWRSGSSELTVTPGAGLSATLGALFAGEGAGSSSLEVDVSGRTYTFPVTVTTRVEGTLSTEGGEGTSASDVVVQVMRGGTAVGSARSGADGRYTVSGLFRGTYDVVPQPSADLLPVPVGQTVTLDQANPTGRADFLMRSFAGLDVLALTPWGDPVAKVGITVLGSDGVEAAKGETDAEGKLALTRLAAGTYSVRVVVPAGFLLTGAPTRPLTLSPGKNSLAVEATPAVQSVRTIPDVLSLEVGTTMEIEAVPVDSRGNIVSNLTSVSWIPGRGLSVNGNLLKATIGALFASHADAPFELRVEINGRLFTFPVTVTSHIGGTITKDPDPVPASGAVGTEAPTRTSVPAQDISVLLKRGGDVIQEARSNEGGVFRFEGLPQGDYEVAASAQGDLSPVPTSQMVVLDELHATGTADFLMSRAPVDSIAVSVSPDTIRALDGTATVTVLAFDTAGAPLSGRTPTYVSTNPAVATVNAGGIVLAVDNGSTWIRITLEAQTDSVLVTVDQRATSLVVRDPLDANPVDTVQGFVTDSGTMTYEARDANGHLIPPSHRMAVFVTGDAGIATVNATGDVTLVGVGIVDLTVTMDDASDVLVVKSLGTHVGDLHINTVGDLTSVQTNLIGRVTGTLYVSDTGLSDLTGLESILEVLGSVAIEGNGSLTSIAGLANLETIGDALTIINNAVLTTPRGVAVALREVGGFVQIDGNNAITNGDVFGHLRTIGGDLKVKNNPALQDLAGLTALDHVEDDVEFVSNGALSSTGNLPAIGIVRGDLVVDAGAVVFGMPFLQAVRGSLLVGGFVTPGNTTLQELRLPSLVCSFGISVYGNHALHTVELPSLTTTDSSCGIGTSPERSAVSSAAARDVPGSDASRERRKSFLKGFAEGARADREAIRKRRDSERLRTRDAQERADARRGAASVVRDMEMDLPASAVSPAYQAYLDRRAARDADPVKPDNKPTRREKPTRPELEYAYDGRIDFWDNTVLTSLSLPALTNVDAGFSFSGNSALTGVSIPSLNQVGGEFGFSNNNVLTSISAPKLEGVNDLSIYNNPALTSMSLPVLNDIFYDVDVDSNDMLGQLVLPALTYVSDDIDIDSNDALARIEFPLLGYVGDEIDIYNNPTLSVLEIATAASLNVEYGVYISSNPALTSVRIPGLNQTYDDFDLYNNVINGSVVIGSSGPLNIGYDLEVSNNGGNFTFSAPGLVWVGDDIDIYNNSGLTSFTAATTGGPATVGYEIYFWYNDALTSVSLPNITDVYDDVEVGEHPVLQTFSMPGVTHIGYDLVVQYGGTPGQPLSLDFSSLQTVDEDLEFYELASSMSPSFPALTTVGDDMFVQDNTGMTSLDFPVLTMADELYVSSNTMLSTFSAPNLAEAPNGVDILSNPALTTLNLGSLARTVAAPLPTAPVTPAPLAGSGVFVFDNDALPGFDLSALQGAAYVHIENNDVLASLPGLPALHPGVSVYIQDNSALTNLNGLAGVTRLYTVQVMGNHSLTDVSGMGALEDVWILDLQDNDGLAAWSLPGLVKVWNSFNLAVHAGLTSVSAPNLTTLGSGSGAHATTGSLSLSGNPLLTSALFPALATLDSRLYVQNTGLMNLDGFSGLTSPVHGVFINANPALTSVSGLAGIGNTFANPAVVNGFSFTGNTSLCSDSVDSLVATIEAKNPGSAFGVPAINTGNASCPT